MIKLPDVLPKKDGFMLSKSHSDIGKLLFTNGIYDFYTGQFTEGFDSSVVFRNAMPRAFSKKDQEKVDFIRNISFNESFEDADTRDLLLHNLMRASIGDFRRKKMTVGLGFTNSGKGMLTQLVRTSFGSYASSFNGNSMIGSFDGNESSRKIGWVSDICNSRFAFSSEIQVDEKNRICIDGNILKNLVSGGDEMKSRRLYENDRTIINKSSLFILANDMPRISPVDDAIRNRVQVVNWSYSYVDEPKKSYERQCKPELSNLYKQDEYGNAFFWLMVEEFEKWKVNGFAEPKTPECVIQGRDDLLPVVDIEEVLLQKYEITKNPEDTIPAKEIIQWLKDNEVKDSDQKIGRELTALGLTILTKTVNRRTIKVRVGLKERVGE
jgi:phage/plasmid-associated DNA primase